MIFWFPLCHKNLRIIFLILVLGVYQTPLSPRLQGSSCSPKDHFPWVLNIFGSQYTWVPCLHASKCFGTSSPDSIICRPRAFHKSPRCCLPPPSPITNPRCNIYYSCLCCPHYVEAADSRQIVRPIAFQRFHLGPCVKNPRNLKPSPPPSYY